MAEWIVPAEKELDKEEISYLKEHGARELVRCKDCKHGEECIKPYKDYWCHLHDFYQYGDWFCADGRKKDD